MGEYNYIKYLVECRIPLILERNKILDGIKYYLPWYRKKLKTIESKLDILDMEIYLLQQYEIDYHTQNKYILKKLKWMRKVN